MNRLVLAGVITATCARGLVAEETSPPVEPLTVADLQKFLDAYTLSLTPGEVSAVTRFAETARLEGKQQKLIDQLLNARDSRAMEALVQLAKSDTSGFLRNEFAKSKDALVRFIMNVELAKAGNLAGGKALLELLHDRSTDIQLQRALRAYFGIFGVKPDTKDAAEIMAILKPRDAVNLIGKQAPQFTVKTKSGQTVSLSDLRGKVVLLHFWATWCGPCMEQMPELKAALDKYPGEKLVPVFVSLDFDESSFRKAVDQLGLPGHQVLSEAGTNGGIIRRAYGIRSAPFDVVIDESGIVRSYSIRDVSRLVPGHAPEPQDGDS